VKIQHAYVVVSDLLYYRFIIHYQKLEDKT